MPVVLWGMAFAALAIDLPVARFCAAGAIPSGVREFFENTETFGHAYGVALILGAVAVLDRRVRKLPRLALCAFGSGMMANLVKVCVGRSRPRDFSALGTATEIRETFSGWLPTLTSDSVGQSFPSAHTATAIGFALGLAWMYPRGRFYFGLLAVCVGCQRVLSSSHFPSDVCAGAAIGWLTATCILSGPLTNRWTQWESGS